MQLELFLDFDKKKTWEKLYGYHVWSMVASGLVEVEIDLKDGDR